MPRDRRAGLDGDELHQRIRSAIRPPLRAVVGPVVETVEAMRESYLIAVEGVRTGALVKADPALTSATGSVTVVNRAIRYLREHFATNPTLTETAAAVYVTPNHLSRVFHEVTGRKYTDWLNSLRIEKAKELLSDWALKLYEVADRVGFTDYKYFVRVFRRYAGCRPSEYRSRISGR